MPKPTLQERVEEKAKEMYLEEKNEDGCYVESGLLEWDYGDVNKDHYRLKAFIQIMENKFSI